MTVRTDNRLLDSPLVPVSCKDCGAVVLARKSSWEQTSVQWDAPAMRRCAERRDAAAIGQHTGGLFLACSKLRDSIDEAARSGALAIAEE
jgi:hypothetical protein